MKWDHHVASLIVMTDGGLYTFRTAGLLRTLNSELLTALTRALCVLCERRTVWPIRCAWFLWLKARLSVGEGAVFYSA